ncbi:MAG: zinc metallopeptidase [Opitutales bacterium]|nr:zinc metallopeptidase [Opitutales bacterium]
MTPFVLLLVFTFGIALYAQWRVSSAYNKYSKIASRSGITGAEAADALMRKAGVTGVQIVPIQGKLTDHYDPINKRLALSEPNYYGNSLAALGVAAHEAGHAIQHKQAYAPLKARMALVPVTTISSKVLPMVFIGAILVGFGQPMGIMLMNIVIACYFILTLFQLITLPVEFDASRRARKELAGLGIINRDEETGVVRTLNAAGFTYVAAFLTSLAYLLYLIAMTRR